MPNTGIVKYHVKLKFEVDGLVEKADIIVVIANRPSYGTAIEMYIAKNSNKKVILLANDPVPTPTPWPVNFSDYVVRNEEDLMMLLEELRKEID